MLRSKSHGRIGPYGGHRFFLASPVSPGAVTASLIGFLLVYAILFISFLWFAGRLVFRGSIAMGAGEIAGHPWHPRLHSAGAVSAATVAAPAE